MDWRRGERSATSSRKRVPPREDSMAPGRSRCASVKAPLACPKSSDSRIPSAKAEQFTGTRGPERPDRRCTSSAASSLPLPVGPRMSTGRSESATRSSSRRTVAMGSLPSVRSGPESTGDAAGRRARIRASHGAMSSGSRGSRGGASGAAPSNTVPTEQPSQIRGCPRQSHSPCRKGARAPSLARRLRAPSGGGVPAPRE